MISLFVFSSATVGNAELAVGSRSSAVTVGEIVDDDLRLTILLAKVVGDGSAIDIGVTSG